MGTLSKRSLREFGVEHKGRVDEARRNARTTDVEPKPVPRENLPPPPSSMWFALAGASLFVSVVLRMARRHQTSLFVGQWVPTFLMFALYHEIVKAAGRQRRVR